ncbi:MAG: hypothetical protein J7L47_01055 [Candidatus Odinarchaeota archaeon]|nr:hypothetical protein [Candidatus Odinarchaeota archaeon]
MSPKHNKFDFNDFKKQRRYNGSHSKNGMNKYKYSTPNKKRHLVNWGAVSLYKSIERGLLSGTRETYQLDFVLELPANSFLHIGSGIVKLDPPLTADEKRKLEKGNLQVIQHLISRSRMVEDIARQNDKTPIIPGSSLKGALRARLELLLTDLYSCFIITGKPHGKPSRKYQSLYRPLTRRRIRDVEVDLLDEERNEISSRDREYFRKKVCIVCDMFGRGNDSVKKSFLKPFIKIKVPALMSKLQFSDAILVTEPKITKKEMYGVPHYVVVGPASFSAKIVAYNIHKVELALILFGLTYKYKGEPLLLGRYKYYRREYGRINVPFEKIKIRKIDVIKGVPKEVPFQDFSNLNAVETYIRSVLNEWSIQQ